MGAGERGLSGRRFRRRGVPALQPVAVAVFRAGQGAGLATPRPGAGRRRRSRRRRGGGGCDLRLRRPGGPSHLRLRPGPPRLGHGRARADDASPTGGGRVGAGGARPAPHGHGGGGRSRLAAHRQTLRSHAAGDRGRRGARSVSPIAWTDPGLRPDQRAQAGPLAGAGVRLRGAGLRPSGSWRRGTGLIGPVPPDCGLRAKGSAQRGGGRRAARLRRLRASAPLRRRSHAGARAWRAPWSRRASGPWRPRPRRRSR